jgi:hypothetical protein
MTLPLRRLNSRLSLFSSIQYPEVRRLKEFTNNRFLRYVEPDDIARLKLFQPYKRLRKGQLHPLPKLVKLSNIDKHRRLHLIVVRPFSKWCGSRSAIWPGARRRMGIPMRARVVACLLQLATVDLTLRRYDTDGRRSDEHRAARKPALSVQRKRRDCPARTTIPPRVICSVDPVGHIVGPDVDA